MLLGNCECVLRTRPKRGREEGDWPPAGRGSGAALARSLPLSLAREGRFVLSWASLCRRR